MGKQLQNVNCKVQKLKLNLSSFNPQLKLGRNLECNDSIVAEWQKQSFCTPKKKLNNGGKFNMHSDRNFLFIRDLEFCRRLYRILKKEGKCINF